MHTCMHIRWSKGLGHLFQSMILVVTIANCSHHISRTLSTWYQGYIWREKNNDKEELNHHQIDQPFLQQQLVAIPTNYASRWRHTWVIPSEINMRNGHPSQISSKLGTHIIGVDILRHDNFWCPVLYGFLVIMHKICTFLNLIYILYYKKWFISEYTQALDKLN